MTATQLSLFGQGQDLPLFQAAQQEQPKPQPRRRRPLPFTVKMTFQDANMPAWIQGEPTEERAAATMRHWFATIAGVRSIMIEDSEQAQRHIYTPAGYMFTVPII